MSGPALMQGWTIYDHPLDHPEHFVVRRWWIESGNPNPVHSRETLLCATLDAARQAVPPWAHCVGRQTEDDPVIVETWL